MSHSAMMELPLYDCHKQVRACLIKEVRALHLQLIPADEKLAPIELDQQYFDKHRPQAGGYFVVYEDGYKSYSPAEAFEGGYKLHAE